MKFAISPRVISFLFFLPQINIGLYGVEGADSAKGALASSNGWDCELHLSPMHLRVVLIYPMEASGGSATSVPIQRATTCRK
jgi:hypothetical protein